MAMRVARHFLSGKDRVEQDGGASSTAGTLAAWGALIGVMAACAVL
jgi:hypothetical protein